MIKVVKSISAVLGIFICVALGALGYGLYFKDSEPQNQPSEVVNVPSGPVAPIAVGVANGVDIGEIALGQPNGSTIASVQPLGALVYLTVKGGGRADRVVVVDLHKRRVVGQINTGSLSSVATPAPLPANPGAIAPVQKSK